MIFATTWSDVPCASLLRMGGATAHVTHTCRHAHTPSLSYARTFTLTLSPRLLTRLHSNFGATCLVLLFFGWAVLPLMYCFSFLFSTSSTAVSVMIIFNTLVCGLGPSRCLSAFYPQDLSFLPPSISATAPFGKISPVCLASPSARVSVALPLAWLCYVAAMVLALESFTHPPGLHVQCFTRAGLIMNLVRTCLSLSARRYTWKF